MRVLIVDDEPDVLFLCRINLELAGHEVIEASTGERAIDLAMRETPDVIVLDVMLPRRDGISVLGDLTTDERTRETPVILLTAKTQAEDRAAGWAAGCAEYLTKPFSPIDLTEAVDRVVDTTIDERDERRDAELRRLARHR
jgi:DNA-binding response OmpR family regulator